MESDSIPTEQIQKLENKIKLSNLLTGKKFADLELTMGNFEQKIKDISTDFPKLKERAEEIEDLLNIINLGLVEFKNNFDNLNSRFADIQKIPAEVGKKMTHYENRLNSLDENVKKLSENLSTLNTINDEINETIKKTVLPNFEAFKVSNEDSKVEIEHMKKDLETFSSAVKSFGRTVELTNIDVLIRRFGALDEKILNTQSQLEDFKTNLHGLTLAGEDVAILKKKIDEINLTLIEKLGNLSEFERDVNILQQKVHDFNFFETSNELKSSLVEKETMINDNKVKIEELSDRLDRLSEAAEKTITSYKGALPETAGQTEQTETGELYNKIREMYVEINNKISQLKSFEGSGELSPNSAANLIRIGERMNTMEKYYNDLVDVVHNELKNIKDGSTTNIATENLRKELNEYRKQMDNRLRLLESRRMEVAMPKDLMKEISLLKENTSRLLTENNELRKLSREVRIAQLEAVKPDVFAILVDRVGVMGKKMSEIEEGAGKGPVTKLELGNLEKINMEIETLKSILKDKESITKSRMNELEQSLSKGSKVLDQSENVENMRKEIENLKLMLQEKESSMENKISKLEKKLREEYGSQPVILE